MRETKQAPKARRRTLSADCREAINTLREKNNQAWTKFVELPDWLKSVERMSH